MRIAVISDLHLGSGGPADFFGHDDTDFLRFLCWLENNFERIVLLGDVWETLTGVCYGNPALELSRARRTHREIARRFEGPAYRYVHGNHDLVAAEAGAPEAHTVTADGVRLLFTHGHQNDFIVQNARLVSELGVWLGAWIRRFGLDSVYRLARTLDGRRGGATVDAKTCGFQRWAMTLAASGGADVVVTGHTHMPTSAEHGARLFMNSGSCADGKFSFLSLDTARGNYGVHSSW